ncbi:PaaI family thioesterase [Actinomadura macrotermitis]|uniref:Thioesterase domain-containing protein n=1 Tax=Actinomadura macrotermitis TaxID=2585200 RepID=A0A7K0C3A8_9ACTN|nr:hotdog domain-containing protein [Actinomadura macrotermitis]MQY07920.1 hypothetical protein [Actinomadura macrotermitis]
MASSVQSINERIAPGSICWACGPARSDGLGLRHHPAGKGVTAEWQGGAFYEGAPGRLHNGLLAVLLEEVSGWAAIHHVLQERGRLNGIRILGLDVEYLDVVPSDEPVTLEAIPESCEGDVVTTKAVLRVKDIVLATATARLAAN